MRHTHDIKFGLLQVRENGISLRKWSGGTAHLRISKGTLLMTSSRWKRTRDPNKTNKKLTAHQPQATVIEDKTENIA